MVELTPVKEIKAVVDKVFDRLGVPYAKQPYDWDLHNFCLEEAKKLGYPFERDPSSSGRCLLDYLGIGVVIASTAYAHHNNRALQVHLAFVTAFFVYIDDASLIKGSDPTDFARNLILAQPQENQLFTALAHLVQETYRFYHGATGDLISTALLSGIMAMALENRMQLAGTKIDSPSDRFSEFFRRLTGSCQAYSIWVFPPSLATEDFIELLPELGLFINSLNDVLSFYKEEHDGDTLNYISLEAKRKGQSKFEVFRDLADESITFHQTLLEIAKTKDSRVRDSYVAFVRGYVYLHTCDERYRMDELFDLEG